MCTIHNRKANACPKDRQERKEVIPIMASTKEIFDKKGKRCFHITVSRGHGKKPFSKTWYPSEKWSEKTVQRKLKQAAFEFESQCKTEQSESTAKKKTQIPAPLIGDTDQVTVRQYAVETFMPIKEMTISENTRYTYQMFLDKHILPVIGDCCLEEVKPPVLSRLLVDFQREGYSFGSTIKLYNILNGIFKMAYFDCTIETKPMERVQRPTCPRTESCISEAQKALTVEQLRYCLSCLKKVSLKWQTYIILCADTGCRRGELCGLQWQDIDWIESTITIRRNLQYTKDKGVYVEPTKNGKERVVDIGEDSLLLLKRFYERQHNSYPSEWVFTRKKSSEPIHPQSPTKYFRKFGKRNDIPNFHPHLLRHTSASVAITSGADVASVSARLGHSDSSVTLRMYTHANPDSIRRAGQTVRDAIRINP